MLNRGLISDRNWFAVVIFAAVMLVIIHLGSYLDGVDDGVIQAGHALGYNVRVIKYNGEPINNEYIFYRGSTEEIIFQAGYVTDAEIEKLMYQPMRVPEVSDE